MGEGEGLADYEDDSVAQAQGHLGTLGLTGAGRGGGGYGGSATGSGNGANAGPAASTASSSAPRARRSSRAAPSRLDDGDAFAAADEAPREESERRAAPPAPEPSAEAAGASMAAPVVQQQPPVGRVARRPGGQWMRREWYREGAVVTDGIRPSWTAAVAEAEAALRASPDSRDRHRELVRALSRAGELERAEEVAKAWIERDQLDTEALTYLSDVIGREGRRDESIRLLSGVVDLRADDRALHERLASAFERAGMPARACAHRVALAEIRGEDVGAQAAAVRCERGLGRTDAATRLLGALTESSLRDRVNRELSSTTSPSRPHGEIMLDATWSGSSDVDLSLVTPQGTRISWLGGRTTVVGEDGTRVGGEKLGLRRASAGSYAIEVNRTRPDDHTPITGRIQVRALDGSRTIPFTLTGERVIVGRVDVVRRSRTVPVW